LPGPLAAIARLGLVSLEYEGIDGPDTVGFREVSRKQPGSRLCIRNLADPSDDGVILAGSIVTRPTFLANRALLLAAGACYLKLVLGEVLRLQALPRLSVSLPLPRRAVGPLGLQEVADYCCYLCTHYFGIAYGRYVTKRDYRWGIAYAAGPWRHENGSPAVQVPNPDGHFLADPFVVTDDRQRSYVFAEDYDFGTRRGAISVYRLLPDRAEEVGAAIVEPFHLSFPFLFRVDGVLHMCPESSKNRDIRVYECVEFPLRWRLKSILMKDVSAADTMLLEWHGKWWMLTNLDRAGLGDHSYELDVFWADGPLSQNWTPHPRNPIVIDPDHARNGGLLSIEGELHRVCQHQGFNVYGEGVSIRRITRLDETDYTETLVARIGPKFGALGTHHLHSDDHYSVHDRLFR
jgi:hypothetical protein